MHFESKNRIEDRMSKRQRLERNLSFEQINSFPVVEHNMAQPALPGGQGPEEVIKVSKRKGEWHHPQKDPGDEEDPKKAHMHNLEGIAASLGAITLIATLANGAGLSLYLFLTAPVLAGFSASRIGTAIKDKHFLTGYAGLLLNGASWVVGPAIIVANFSAGLIWGLGMISLYTGGYVVGTLLKKYT